jgi:TolB-like protein/Flp pilus assembly protein TadD
LGGRPSEQGSPVETKPSIAVLPLSNMSTDPENEYFADGLTEELLNVLARNPQLRVTARTSSFAFKGKQVDLREVGQKLGVSTILEGSVRKAGNRVRITAQLVKVSDGFHLWSETYDRVLDDIFAVQDDIAKAVAGALKVALLGGKATHYTHQPEAYRLFLQARHFTLRHTGKDVETAVRLFKQALELDPEDALIWAGLAWAYHTQAGYGTAELEKGYLTAKEAAARALALDDECVEAQRAMGVIKLSFEFDWAGSQHHLEKALSLEPSNARCLSSLAFLLLCQRRLDEAMSLFERSIEIDPLAPGAYNNMGVALSSAGRSEEAVNFFRKVLELSPAFLSGHTRLGLENLALGQREKALATIQQESEGGYRDYGLAMALHALGRSAESDAAFASLHNRGVQWSYQIAIVSAYRGDSGSAFHWLETALETHDSGLPTVAVMPLLAGLHSDPRWPKFLQKVGLQP